MSENILTPIQLWQGFNPVREDLNVGYTARRLSADGQNEILEGYFTSETLPDGKVRVFFTIFKPVGRIAPTIVFVPDHGDTSDYSGILSSVGRDYTVITFDYVGKRQGAKDYTVYPPSLDYCNLSKSGDHLSKAIPTAKETCVYQWTKLLRRLLTFINRTAFLSDDIALVGIKRGANLVWQCAAIDARVKTVIPVINAGWCERTEGLTAENIDDERERWLAGCAAESYAKFINCPIFFIGSTNSDITSFNYIDDTFALIPDAVEKKFNMSVGNSHQVQAYGINSIENWLSHIFKGKPFPSQPSIECAVVDNTVHCTVRSDATAGIDNVSVVYSQGGGSYVSKYWITNAVGADMAGISHDVIDIVDPSAEIELFANVFYKDGTVITSKRRTVSAEAMRGVTAPEKCRTSRIIYERKKGVRDFVLENDGFIADNEKISLETGPHDILGVSIPEGHLSTYIVSDKAHKGIDGGLLQFDVYADGKRMLEVALLNYESGALTEYSAKIMVDDSAEWTKVALESGDFKSGALKSLKNWDNIKKLTFRNCGGMLFNNILWV